MSQFPWSSLEIIFWCGVGVIFYVYIGYPLILTMLSLVKRYVRPEHIHQRNDIPRVSLLIPAYNEEKIIAAKIENSLALDYPEEKLEIIVASDGSTDGTNDIVKRYSDKGVKLVTLGTNQGKSAAENACLAVASGDILVFSDATGMYNKDALYNLVMPFSDPEVGCVAGLVKYKNTGATSVSHGEGTYWKYELLLRRLESHIGNLAMASGSIMSCRRLLARPLNKAAGEDFVIPMQIAVQGFRTVFAPAAVSEELVAETDNGLLKTKARIICKDLYGLYLCRAILNPFYHPLYSWGLISHKLLRWLVPYFLVVSFIANFFLLNHSFFNITMTLQIVFYMLALAGFIRHRRGISGPVFGAAFSVPLCFCLVNLAALVGLSRFFAGKRAGQWQPIR